MSKLVVRTEGDSVLAGRDVICSSLPHSLKTLFSPGHSKDGSRHVTDYRRSGRYSLPLLLAESLPLPVSLFLSVCVCCAGQRKGGGWGESGEVRVVGGVAPALHPWEADEEGEKDDIF